MKEYRIDAKIRNNLILKKIEEIGCKTVGEFCRKYNFSQADLGGIINLKERAITHTMEWRNIIIRISDIFGCLPEDIITEEQKTMELKTNKKFIEVSKLEIDYCSNNPGYLIENMTPENLSIGDNAKEIIGKAFKCINERQRKIVEMRILENKTLEECGKYFNVNRERIRQIESKAFRKLREFFQSEGLYLEDYLGIKQ